MDTHKHAEHDHLEPEDLTPREYPLDLPAVRERLAAKSGKEYWRSLEELAENPHFEELLRREFPRQASEWENAVERRDFLKLMAASLALAGFSGCGRRPDETIVPYVKAPVGLTLGKPLYFATAMPMGGDAIGLLVESHEGRPTKVEGNPDHPGSLGGTDVFAQASVLNLYDPDRSQALTYLGQIRAWSEFLADARGAAGALKANRGAGFRILSGSVNSPTLGAQLNAFLAAFPLAKWHQWEPAGSDGAREGGRLAFGRYVNTVFQIEKADVVLALDADFLASGPGHVRYAREFSRRRRFTGESPKLNRLYVVEPTPSVTGSAADHRLPLRPAEVETFARTLAVRLSLGGSASLGGEAEKWLEAVAKDLQHHRGASLVIAGEQQPADVHALAHAVNAALGNIGQTIYYTDPIEAEPVNQLESLRELVADMDAGKVDTLLIVGGNPVYDTPHDFALPQRLRNVGLIVRLGSYYDETSEHSHWHIPESHYLESWSDARAYDGTASIIQPLIAPLYQSKTAHEVLAAFGDKPGQPSYDVVRDFWQKNHAGLDFEKSWQKWLNDGVIAQTTFAPTNVTLKWSPASLRPFSSGLEGPAVIFRPDPGVYDGRFANNGWLQELPRPVTKLTWDNAALVSPKTAEQLGLGHKIGASGGEHGRVFADVVDMKLGDSKVSAAVWIVPGQADNVIVLPLGYGRWRAGQSGTNKGFNAYAVRFSHCLWQMAIADYSDIRKTGHTYPLACTQYHHNMQGRGQVRSASLEDFRRHPDFAREGFEAPPKSLSLYQEYAYPGYAWGLAIDLNACIGCNACVIACQAENNIAVVGKDQVMRGREMHWIRIDRYYQGGLENPATWFQPVPCMQCENAPCEQVCPVGATVHSAEGLNDMVYNRCVGTRYCSNNCPYKVRRFNFLRYQDWETPSLKLLRNPEVTVRSRGVMEKCTYCVQRINNGRIEADKQNRPIRDGEIVTACQAACPTLAIVFGNANDPSSQVAKLKAEQRNYTLLAELNARPRTTYLAAVRNPNPELDPGEQR
jgi:molybdopterin-containing oxidoreductase family iron-sulfur binding subunit